MDHHAMTLWLAYYSGALLPLAYKYARYLYENRKQWMTAQGIQDTGEMRKGEIHWRWQRATREWIFEPSPNNAASWFGTIALVWIGGAVYISGLEWLFHEYFKGLPKHPAIAFALGGALEMAAPNLTKWAASKLPLPKGGGEQ